VNRKVLLIGYSGGGQAPLLGMKSDFKAFAGFFRSNHGGAYNDDEIESHINLTRQQFSDIVRVLHIRHISSVAIVLCLHGGSDKYGQPFYCFSDGNNIYLHEIEDMMRGIPALVIADSCRERWLEPISESTEVRMFSKGGGIQSSREVYRALYDSYIKVLNANTFTVGFACADNEVVDESSRGGLYSQTLIECAETVARQLADSRDNMASFSYIHSLAERVLASTDQNPEYRGTRSRYQFPFVVQP